MAKMTIAGLKTFVASYVDAAKQGAAWASSTDNFVGLLDKIGKQITLSGTFNDKLPELDGDELPLGKTIEEYYIDLTLPEAFTGNNSTEGAKDIVPAVPSVESVVYSYSLGRKKIKTTIPYDNFERAMLSTEGVANVSANIMERLQNSQDLYKFACKKQLLGNAIDKAVTASRVTTIAVPVDDTTGEAFLKQVKKDIEDASFPHEGGLAGALIGAAPELVLYVKKGVMPSIEVDTFAGAFHKEDLALPCRIVVVDDFGTITNTTAWGVLVDPRGIKLHNGYNAVREAPNADGDFLNIVRHSEYTGFISKYCYIKAYKA